MRKFLIANRKKEAQSASDMSSVNPGTVLKTDTQSNHPQS